MENKRSQLSRDSPIMIDRQLCQDAKIGHSASQEMTINALTRVLNHNYRQVLAAALFVIATIMVVAYVIYEIQRTVAHYYRYMVRRDTIDTRMARADNMDDEIYGPQTDRAKHQLEKKRDEYSSIQSRIHQLKNIYRGYNNEMRSYSKNILNRPPDDIIDERILNREDDDYDYHSSR